MFVLFNIFVKKKNYLKKKKKFILEKSAVTFDQFNAFLVHNSINIYIFKYV